MAIPEEKKILQPIRSQSQENFVYTFLRLNSSWGPGGMELQGKTTMPSRDWGQPSLEEVWRAAPFTPHVYQDRKRGAATRSSHDALVPGGTGGMKQPALSPDQDHPGLRKTKGGGKEGGCKMNTCTTPFHGTILMLEILVARKEHLYVT